MNIFSIKIIFYQKNLVFGKKAVILTPTWSYSEISQYSGSAVRLFNRPEYDLKYDLLITLLRSQVGPKPIWLFLCAVHVPSRQFSPEQ